MTDWFTTFFDRVAFDFWDAVVPPEATAAEAAFLEDALRLRPGATVLDVPCGRGRHARALAARGVRVLAVDLAPEAVGAVAGVPGVEAIAADMRALPPLGPVDAAYCFGNSTGYFPPDDLPRFLAGVARAVRPGGRFAVETGSVAECVLPHLGEAFEYEAGGVAMRGRNRYDARRSRLDGDVELVWDGGTSARHTAHHLVTADELRRLVEAAGFAVLDLAADVAGTPFAVGAGRLVLTAERR